MQANSGCSAVRRGLARPGKGLWGSRTLSRSPAWARKSEPPLSTHGLVPRKYPQGPPRAPPPEQSLPLLHLHMAPQTREEVMGPQLLRPPPRGGPAPKTFILHRA